MAFGVGSKAAAGTHSQLLHSADCYQFAHPFSADSVNMPTAEMKPVPHSGGHTANCSDTRNSVQGVIVHTQRGGNRKLSGKLEGT